MKKYTYLALTAALILSACGNSGTMKETESAAVATEQSTEVEETTESVELESDAQEQETTDENEDVRIPYAPLNVRLSAQYEGEWDDKGAIITADSATIHILDDGYEPLKEALEKYNEENWQEVYRVYLENREYAKEDGFPEDLNLFISREISVTRADQKVLSLVNTETSFMGGAHGSYYEDGEVFDAETGAVLELSDVVTDYDKVYDYVMEYLKENYETEMFFDGYEEWIQEMFYEPEGAMAAPIEWNMDMDSLDIRFNPYVIGPWVSGTFEVEIPYEKNEELFVSEYLPSLVGGPIRKIMPDEKITVDTDRDKDPEVIYFTVSEMDEDYMTTVALVVHEDEDLQGAFSRKTEEYYGTFMNAYLVETPDEISEGEMLKYLYLEFVEENDFCRLYVIDLNRNELAKRKLFKQVGRSEASVYGHMIADSGQFSLYSRIYTLGTYLGYKKYFAGADGMPETDEEMYHLVTSGADWDILLTSKRELAVLMHEDGSEEKTEVKLPKGTVFRPLKTDGETVMVMELEDGRRCDLIIERKDGEYQFYINGAGEYDCFENLPYAG